MIVDIVIFSIAKLGSDGRKWMVKGGRIGHQGLDGFIGFYNIIGFKNNAIKEDSVSQVLNPRFSNK